MFRSCSEELALGTRVWGVSSFVVLRETFNMHMHGGWSREHDVLGSISEQPDEGCKRISRPISKLLGMRSVP
jgi:hypothetical protein